MKANSKRIFCARQIKPGSPAYDLWLLLGGEGNKRSRRLTAKIYLSVAARRESCFFSNGMMGGVGDARWHIGWEPQILCAVRPKAQRYRSIFFTINNHNIFVQDTQEVRIDTILFHKWFGRVVKDHRATRCERILQAQLLRWQITPVSPACGLALLCKKSRRLTARRVFFR